MSKEQRTNLLALPLLALLELSDSPSELLVHLAEVKGIGCRRGPRLDCRPTEHAERDLATRRELQGKGLATLGAGPGSLRLSTAEVTPSPASLDDRIAGAIGRTQDGNYKACRWTVGG